MSNNPTTTVLAGESVIPAVVAIGFNRPKSLERLLDSLANARYDSQNVPLVLSIDFSDSDEGLQTRKLATEFEWCHGLKRLILHEKNLGLRKHVLACGDLSEAYGSVILLEDDLTVSRDFYRFTIESLSFVENDHSVGGISLYSHATNFLNRLPFTPLYDGFDNFYLQIASSWGQAWSHSQWKQFRDWYNKLVAHDTASGSPKPIPATSPIPSHVIAWPNSSWLKYFIWYLVESNRYFLYPRISHSTNHSDTGTHASRASAAWQVPISIGLNTLRFSTLDESLSVYDSFFEVLPDRLRKIAPLLEDYDFDVDLYGSKRDDILTRPLVLTSRAVTQQPLLAFGLAKKPLEANFVNTESNAKNTFFSLVTRDQLGPFGKMNLKSFSVFDYFYGVLPLRTLAKNLLGYFWQKRAN